MLPKKIRLRQVSGVQEINTCGYVISNIHYLHTQTANANIVCMDNADADVALARRMWINFF